MTCSAVLLLASTTSATRAQQFVAVTYSIEPGIEACPSASEFRTILAQQLGYDPYRTDAPNSVRVRVQPTATGIEGIIDWIIPDEKQVEERRFVSRRDDCHRMIATVGFVVAVQIQLMAAETASALAVESLTTDATARAASREMVSAKQQVKHVPEMALRLGRFDVRQPDARVANQRMVMVGIGPSIGVGLAPAPTVLGRLFVAARLGAVGLEAGGEQSLPSRATESYGGGFEHRLTLGSLAFCGWQGSISLCALAKLGRIHVDGFGIDRAASSDGFVALLGPRVAHSVRLDNHLHLLGRVEAAYLLTPWTVDLNHVPVWTTPRFSAIAGIDVVASFP